MLQRQLVKLIGSNVEQRRHLVNEGSRTAGAGSVHSLVDCAVEEYYFRVLSAQLYYKISVGSGIFYDLARSPHLLHERYLRALGKSHSGRTRDCGGELFVSRKSSHALEHFHDSLADAGEVPFVGFADDLSRAEQSQLCGSRADVYAECERCYDIFKINMHYISILVFKIKAYRIFFGYSNAYDI